MNKMKWSLATILLILITSIDTYSQKNVGQLGTSDMSFISDDDSIIINDDLYEVVTSTVYMNKDKTFITLYLRFKTPEKNNIFSVACSFHLDESLDAKVKSGKMSFSSFRTIGNLSYGDFAGVFKSSKPVYPGKFATLIQWNIPKGRYFKTYWFNSENSEANLEITYKVGYRYDYNVSMTINLIESEASDIDGKRLGADIFATHKATIVGIGHIDIPKSFREK